MTARPQFSAPVAPSLGVRGAARSTVRAEWVGATAIIALIVTAVDAALVQRKHDLFTNGFLAADHLRGPGEIAAYLLGSVISDFGVAGVMALVGLWLARKLQLGQIASRLLAVSFGLVPLLTWDVISYRLLEYLGDAFDLTVIFDLVGRRPGELVAFAAAPIVEVALLACLSAVAIALVIWLLNRRYPATKFEDDRPAGRSVSWLAWLAFGFALVATTALRLDRASLENGLSRKPSAMLLGGLVALTTDFDRDGYGLMSRVRDAAMFDARIHPYAIDIPGNGVDEDGIGGDLPADYPRYTEPTGKAPEFVRRPDVILFFLETFRPDIVGATLNGHRVTPRLDALVRSGVASGSAWSHNGYTVQSRFHVLSGSLANLRDGTTLIDDFNANGYETAYFSGQDDSFGSDILPVSFEHASVFYDARQDRDKRYTFFATPASLAVPFTLLRDRVTTFLSHRDSTRPLFMYVNFYDTHFPYTHQFVKPLVDSTIVKRSDIGPARGDDLRRMYMNTAANVDGAIGDVIDEVRRTTGREPALVVTADHGESLFEEGFLGHGYGLNEAQTRIPLIVSGLPMVAHEPWGQWQLRDEIRAALLQPEDAQPRIERRAGGMVFQYIGELPNPAQIALRNQNGAAIYDFRSERFQSPETGVRSPAELQGRAKEVFLRLVHDWESMVLAVQQRRAAVQ